MYGRWGFDGALCLLPAGGLAAAGRSKRAGGETNTGSAVLYFTCFSAKLD